MCGSNGVVTVATNRGGYKREGITGILWECRRRVCAYWGWRRHRRGRSRRTRNTCRCIPSHHSRTPECRQRLHSSTPFHTENELSSRCSRSRTPAGWGRRRRSPGASRRCRTSLPCFRPQQCRRDWGEAPPECDHTASSHLFGKHEPCVSGVHEEDLGVAPRDPENASVRSAERREESEAVGEFGEPLVRRGATRLPRAAWE